MSVTYSIIVLFDLPIPQEEFMSNLLEVTEKKDSRITIITRKEQFKYATFKVHYYLKFEFYGKELDMYIESNTHPQYKEQYSFLLYSDSKDASDFIIDDDEAFLLFMLECIKQISIKMNFTGAFAYLVEGGGIELELPAISDLHKTYLKGLLSPSLFAFYRKIGIER